MTDHNIPLGSENIVFSRGFTFPDGVEGLKNLIKQFPDATAIFAASDEMAIGALSAAYQMGIRVPDEVSVIGYDNLNLAEMSIPPLTTVEQPLAKMGETAAEMLFSILETGETPESRIMPHKIIERMSVKESKS